MVPEKPSQSESSLRSSHHPVFVFFMVIHPNGSAKRARMRSSYSRLMTSSTRTRLPGKELQLQDNTRDFYRNVKFLKVHYQLWNAIIDHIQTLSLIDFFEISSLKAFFQRIDQFIVIWVNVLAARRNVGHPGWLDGWAAVDIERPFVILSWSSMRYKTNNQDKAIHDQVAKMFVFSFWKKKSNHQVSARNRKSASCPCHPVKARIILIALLVTNMLCSWKCRTSTI